ncbi:MAG: hypothetical protein RIT27_554 [Pseudomonadota bacterium]|jgi:hypothetical protein
MVCGLALLASGQIFAATITVNSTSGTTTTGVCTLQDALTSANTDTATGGCVAGSGADIIVFDASLSGQTITRNTVLPSLTTNITIDGSSLASHVIISAVTYMRPFNVNSGGVLTLTHLDIVNGNVSPFAGAINVNSGGTLTLNNCTLSGNTAVAGGTGGGAISNYGTVTVNNSTFSNNHADSTALYGGGAIMSGGTLTINNSTFSGNTSSSGGALFISGGTVVINNSTFSDNTSTGNGGNILNKGTLTLKNTILANATGVDCYNNGGTVSITNSLIETNGSSPNNCGTPTLTADPNLGALANNGGKTQTLALLTGSPAINAGDTATCLSTDQRGSARVGICDVGAFEYTPPTPAPIDFSFSNKQVETFATDIEMK